MSTRAALALIAAAAAITAAALLLPVSQWLLQLAAWIKGAGAVGVLVYVLVFIAATLLLIPGSILTAAAGFAYGPLWGTLLVSVASVVAATLAFVLGHSLLRGWAARRLVAHPRLLALSQATRRSGYYIVLLLRLSPVVPFNLLNYALSLTPVRMRDYVLASLIGMLPGTALYVYLGSMVTNASQLLSGGRSLAGGWGEAMYALGLVATVAVTVLTARIARRELARASGEATKESPSDSNRHAPL